MIVAEIETDAPIPIWGGFECSVVRIGEEYRDEAAETGHKGRLEDLDIVPWLGVRTLRYGVLWERIAPTDPAERQWQSSDLALKRLQELEVDPIVGLLHHGSGPSYTDLLDPRFPRLLADYARSVAERYPWVTRYTPVNEPGTTARFSCLYGHWFPHRRDTTSFLRALFNQAYGTALAMRAIRTATPHARLIQTEELGRIFSTQPLQYQAAYENERRWLSLDLLCGRIRTGHSWYVRFLDAGVDAHLLKDLSDTPCPPDVIGINYYLTSDRFLDHRLIDYPAAFHGGNGRDVYADSEAIRAPDVVAGGNLTSRIMEAWRRYSIPVAVTEVHNGCTREEQMRWLADCYASATRARTLGANVPGFAVWALAGAVDWDSLLTRRIGQYESGVLEARGRLVRKTALAKMVKALVTTGRYHHPVLEDPGWWQREIRFHGAKRFDELMSGRPLLIVGTGTALGRAFSALCALRGLATRLWSDMRPAAGRAVECMIDEMQPWAIIDASSDVRLRNDEMQYRPSKREAGTAEILARASCRRSIPLVTFSSDLIFDGQLGRAYVETDTPTPTSNYGSSIASLERSILRWQPRALIVRTSAVFGPWDQNNFIHSVISSLRAGVPYVIATDSRLTPAYLPDLVNRALDLLIDGETGLWHLANDSAVSWSELGRSVAQRTGLDPTLVVARPVTGLDTSLASIRGLAMPPLDAALGRYFSAQGAT
jgi:dTDP-4-dehydrorhamnose reductase